MSFPLFKMTSFAALKNAMVGFILNLESQEGSSWWRLCSRQLSHFNAAFVHSQQAEVTWSVPYKLDCHFFACVYFVCPTSLRSSCTSKDDIGTPVCHTSVRQTSKGRTPLDSICAEGKTLCVRACVHACMCVCVHACVCVCVCV
jgi:hypothetical protein